MLTAKEFGNIALGRLKNFWVGFYLTLASFIVAIVAFALYGKTAAIMFDEPNRYNTVFTVMCIWIYVLVILNTVLVGRTPVFLKVINILPILFLIFSLMEFIEPCLEYIGMWVMKLGMLDPVKTAAAPQVIATSVMYAIAAVLLLVASFFNLTRSDKEVKVKKQAATTVAPEAEVN